MLPEQRKRTRTTSPPVDNVIREKRSRFRHERRLLVPAYGLFRKNPGFYPRSISGARIIHPTATQLSIKAQGQRSGTAAERHPGKRGRNRTNPNGVFEGRVSRHRAMRKPRWGLSLSEACPPRVRGVAATLGFDR